jgi:replicative DNA helicase
MEAEQACIGAMLMSSGAISSVREFLNDDDFFDDRHRVLFNFICELNDRNLPADLVTVTERLTASRTIEKVGGSAYLSKLVESVPATSNVGTYARIVLEKSMLRNLINASRTIVDSVYDQSGNVEKIFDEAERGIFDVTGRRIRSEYHQLKDILNPTLKHIGDRKNQGHGYTGVVTRFRDLDELTDGLQKGSLIILAARPGMGKTAFALNLSVNVSKYNEHASVLIFSLEMAFQELVIRMLASESHLDMKKIHTGKLDENKGEWAQLVQAAGSLSNLQIYIDDKPMISLNEIRAIARRIKAKNRLDMIVIDHLQLITTADSSKNPASANRNTEISYISRSLKALAKELDLPVVCLSQLSRGVEQRTDPIPKLSDLRESGAIEQDADIVAFLYRDEYYSKENSTQPGLAELRVEKHRNGSTGVVPLTFIKESVRFETAEIHRDQMGPPPAADSGGYAGY